MNFAGLPSLCASFILLQKHRAFRL